MGMVAVKMHFHGWRPLIYQKCLTGEEALEGRRRSDELEVSKIILNIL